MTTRNGFHERIKTLLQDSQADSWSEAELDEGLRQAISAYNQVSPQARQAVVAVEKPGCEVSLAGLPGLTGVTGVWWPYHPGDPAAPQPPNQLLGYRLRWDGDRPVLFLTSFRGRLPRPGDHLRIWYSCPHTIEGLDGGTETTLPDADASLIVAGATGFAAASACLDRGETLLPGLLEKSARAWLEEFHWRLEALRAGPGSSGAEPWRGGWEMDRWETT